MKNLFQLLVVTCCSFKATGQVNLDSLYLVWNDETKVDSVRVDAYLSYLYRGYMFINPDTAYELAEALFDYGKENNYPKAVAYAHHYQGISWLFKTEYSKALASNEKALEIRNRIGDTRGVSKSLGNIGLIYQGRGAYNKALNYHIRSLKIKEEFNDKKGMANAYNNLGSVYETLGEWGKAFDYYSKSVKLNEELGELRTLSGSLTNLGVLYNNRDEPYKAIEYFNRALEIAEKSDDRDVLIALLGNLGRSAEFLGDTAKALGLHLKSLEVATEYGSKKGMATALMNLGILNGRQGKHAVAIDFCLEAYELACGFDSFESQNSACQCLIENYKALANTKKALEFHELHDAIEDSLQVQEASEQLQQFEFQKQMLADSIANAEEARIVEEAHKEEVRKKNKTRNALIGGGLFLFLIAGGIYSRLRYTRKAKAEIEKEKDRSENLLLNILPADIAAELKEKGRADARDFEKVSILFTDFKGFTAASEKLSAQDLVSEINTCFEAFDGIMGKYGIEKIKTIGDAYMAAGGLPVPSVDSVKNTVLAALEMQAFISERKAKLDAEGKPGFEMRVGLHTGPVVAGIVGVKKFQYDIWGDTVNTASRMESSGEVGKVNISEATFELMKDDAQFSFESRGKIEAKGKGEMEMYFITQKG